MADQNFYQWLELPVEQFEGDPAKLTKVLDDHILAWNSAKSPVLQRRAQLFEGDMRAAINDPNKWKQIYNEYKKAVDEEIMESLNYIGTDISSEDIKNIAENEKVSESYVSNLAAKGGYKVGKTKEDSAKQEKKLSLKDITPPSTIKAKLDSIQSTIEGLNYKNIADFCNAEIESGGISLESSTKEEILKTLDALNTMWKKKKISEKKTAISTICVGMKGFLDKSEMKEYLVYLQSRKISALLNKMNSDLKKLNRETLLDEPFNVQVDEIYSILGRNYTRDDARSVLESFCEEKGIAYPKPLPKIAACPYCRRNFEKSDPIQSNCPVCGKTLVVTCPKCGKPKNMITDGVCDGVTLLRYPILQRKLEGKDGVEGSLERLAFQNAKSVLAEIEEEWANFPGVKPLREKCQKLEKEYGAEIAKIEQLFEEKKLHEAKRNCERIAGSFPAVKERFHSLYETLSQVNILISDFQKVADQSKKKALLRELLNLVVDDPIVNRELPRVENITDLKAEANSANGTVTISWKSKNEAGSVDYHVIRKNRSMVANPDDGEEVTQTRNLSYSDTTALEGEAYYYAVYASMGPINGELAVLQTPVIVLADVKMQITAKNKAIDVSWSPVAETVRAFYSESKITAFGQGTEISNVTQSGFRLEGLTNEKTYYLACFKTAKEGGKEFISAGAFGMATPAEDVIPPILSKSMGANAGEYILTHENPQEGQVFQLYYSSSASIEVPTGQNMDISALQSKLKKLDAKSLGKNAYSVVLENQAEMIVYPVLCRGRIVTVGDKVNLKYIKPVKVTDRIVTGNRLCLKLEAWPEGAEKLYICYNFDYFPEDIRDCQKRIAVTKTEYAASKLLEILDIKPEKYYIAIFAQRLGENIPVCNELYDNQKKCRIEYSFSVDVFGKLTVKLDCEDSFRPELYLLVNRGCVPLVFTPGAAVMTIPAASVKAGAEKIAVPGFRAEREMYGKLFANDKSCDLILKGPAKLK